MASTQDRPVSRLERAVAARLRSEIALRQVSKTKLAETIGVHRTHLSRVIHGHTHIDLDLLADLCQALGVNIVALFHDAQRDAAREYGPDLAADELLAELDEVGPYSPDAPDERPEAG